MVTNNWNIFTQTPEQEKLFQAEQEKYQILDASQELNNFNSKELSNFPSLSSYSSGEPC